MPPPPKLPTIKGTPLSGWYDDPDGGSGKRYWDGTDWTDGYFRDGTYYVGNRAVEAERIEVNRLGVGLALVGAVVMIVAVFLPRVESRKFFSVAENTLIQSSNGWWFIAIAILASLAVGWIVWQQTNSYSVLLLGLAGIGLAIFAGTGDRLTLHSIGSDQSITENATAGVGIYAAGVGGLIVAIGGLLLAGLGDWLWFGTPQNPARKTKRCPDCAETVLVDAKICKHCGYRFEPSGPEPALR